MPELDVVNHFSSPTWIFICRNVKLPSYSAFDRFSQRLPLAEIWTKLTWASCHEEFCIRVRSWPWKWFDKQVIWLSHICSSNAMKLKHKLCVFVVGCPIKIVNIVINLKQNKVCLIHANTCWHQWGRPVLVHKQLWSEAVLGGTRGIPSWKFCKESTQNCIFQPI